MKKSVVLMAAVSTVIAVGATAVTAVGVAGADDAAINYKTFCASCHGDGGGGDGPNAATLPNRPQNFMDCAAMSKMPDDTMLKAIKAGGAAVGLPSTMPAWAAGLTDDQIRDLVVYIRAFCKK